MMLQVQAMVDVNKRFLWASALCSGATHDSLALALSEFGQAMDDLLPDGYWIAGDDAYVLRYMSCRTPSG